VPAAAPRRADYRFEVGKLFLLFTLLPFIDLWVLLEIGRAIGFWPTVALAVGTGIAGAWLAKTEGLRVVRAWQRALEEGRMPEEGILSGMLVLAGAALLVTPGVITDVIGLVLLFPPTRRLAAEGLRRYLTRRMREGRIRVVTFGHGPAGPPGSPGPAADEVIDVTPRREPPTA
jgi:UPF0716 protein FxsA